MNNIKISKVLLSICILLVLSSFICTTVEGKTKVTKLISPALQQNQDNSILGVYTCKDSDAVMQFESNRRFSISQTNRVVTGTYRIQGDTVIMSLMSVSIRLRFDGNTITDADGKRWMKDLSAMVPQDKPKAQTVKNNFFSFELQGCRRSGSAVSCEFVITNEDKDRRLVFGDYNSKLFDNMGNEGRPKNVLIANQSGMYFADTVMVSGVPVKARVEFEGISPQATRISLMTILCFTRELSGSYTDQSKVEFRNIPLNQ